MNGIFLLNKDADMTSFSCCSVLRRLLGARKTGHAGTLDPMATGVLPILCGNATRALSLLPIQDKRYTATFRFGLTSDTEDIWGDVTSTGAAHPPLSAVEEALAAFRGEIWQVPPMMSAVQQNGVRLYQLARQGVTVEREARRVTVYWLEIVEYRPETGELTVDCACSKGTYIRTIGSQLGQALGCGAVMTALCRTEAAGYQLADCLTLADVRAMGPEERHAAVLPTESLFFSYPRLTVTAAQSTRFANGGSLLLSRLSEPVTQPVRVCDPHGTFLGIGSPNGEDLVVTKLFPVVD